MVASSWPWSMNAAWRLGSFVSQLVSLRPFRSPGPLLKHRLTTPSANQTALYDTAKSDLRSDLDLSACLDAQASGRLDVQTSFHIPVHPDRSIHTRALKCSRACRRGFNPSVNNSPRESSQLLPVESVGTVLSKVRERSHCALAAVDDLFTCGS